MLLFKYYTYFISKKLSDSCDKKNLIANQQEGLSLCEMIFYKIMENLPILS